MPLNISNRPLYDLLCGVYREIPSSSKIDEIEKWYRQQGAEALQMRAAIRQRLENSALAQILPGGFDLLPDFYAAVPAWARFWYRLFRPRNYYQLGRHVAVHLQWYLQPAEGIDLPVDLQTVLLNLSAIALVLAIPIIGPDNISDHWLRWLFPWIVLALTAHNAINRKGGRENVVRTDVERIELYQYLSREYSEAVVSQKP